MSSEPEYGAAEYLCFEVIRQVENRGREVPETAFNKLCALVYDELGEQERLTFPTNAPVVALWRSGTESVEVSTEIEGSNRTAASRDDGISRTTGPEPEVSRRYAGLTG